MWPQDRRSRSTRSEPQNGNQNSDWDHLDVDNDPMGSLSSDLQRLELRRLRPTPVRPQSVGGISQSQNTPASTPTMSHSQPELPSAPRGPRVQSFDPWNISFPSPDFQSGLWTAFGANQTQTNGVASQSSSIPQEIAGTGRNLIDRQTNGNQTHPNAQPWRTGSCCCRSVWITISGPPIVTFICHCNTCKQIFGSDRVSLARYRINDVNISNQRDIKWYQVDNVAHFFCGTCGTVFEMRPFSNTGESVVPIALLDDQSGTLAPQMEIYCSQQVPWLPVLAPSALRYDHAPPPFSSHVHWPVPDNV